uniref:Putative secreted peptide n=1 Tax=Anopheles braziliensis TaxID=58242 RepID=A0A2M3ZMH4_9DIPT
MHMMVRMVVMVRVVVGRQMVRMVQSMRMMRMMRMVSGCCGGGGCKVMRMGVSNQWDVCGRGARSNKPGRTRTGDDGQRRGGGGGGRWCRGAAGRCSRRRRCRGRSETGRYDDGG